MNCIFVLCKTRFCSCIIFTFLANSDYMKFFVPSIKMFLVANTKEGLIFRDRLIGFVSYPKSSNCKKLSNFFKNKMKNSIIYVSYNSLFTSRKPVFGTQSRLPSHSSLRKNIIVENCRVDSWNCKRQWFNCGIC